MYKCKLQEQCQRRSWNLPEYTTVKDGSYHIPQFTAIVAVNGHNFETLDQYKSSKDTQNTAARIAFDHFNVPPLAPVSSLPNNSCCSTSNAYS